MDKLERLPEWRDLPNVWSGGVGPKLLEITWSVQGRSSARAPDNLYEWLIANNRYPQHRGRSAALRFIQEQFDEITRLKGEVERLTWALADLRTWAAVLHQNSVGCAENHHGADLERFGMPGWLDDAGASISRATDLLARSSGKAGSDAAVEQ